MIRKSQRFTSVYLDELIEEWTVDAYNESEQLVGFSTMIDDNLALPFNTPAPAHTIARPLVPVRAGARRRRSGG